MAKGLPPSTPGKKITPESKADMDAKFETLLRDLADQAGIEAVVRVVGGQVKWMMPDDSESGWPGDLFLLEELGTPFDREAINDMFRDVIADPHKPGTSGDVVLTTTQIEYLAVMERAFRARHTMRRPRATVHAMGRKAVHGDPGGTFYRGVLDYLTGVKKMAGGGSVPQPTDVVSA
jgi:hypothetical protein